MVLNNKKSLHNSKYSIRVLREAHLSRQSKCWTKRTWQLSTRATPASCTRLASRPPKTVGPIKAARQRSNSTSMLPPRIWMLRSQHLRPPKLQQPNKIAICAPIKIIFQKSLQGMILINSSAISKRARMGMKIPLLIYPETPRLKSEVKTLFTTALWTTSVKV